MLRKKSVACLVFLAAFFVGGGGLLASKAYADAPEGWDENFYECVGRTYDEMKEAGTVNHDNLPIDFADFTDDDLDRFLPKIKTLVCYDMGIEDTFGLEKMIRLEHLALTKNSIKTIDLSENKSLKAIHLWGNDLESIDISGLAGNLTTLYLDDNVLVKGGFTAEQLAEDGDYYAAVSTNGDDFAGVQSFTGLYRGYSEIVTEGAHYYNNENVNNDECLPEDPFCIVFDADILDYQNYIQLRYVGPNLPSDYAGYNYTKLNYRLEINLDTNEEEDDKEDGEDKEDESETKSEGDTETKEKVKTPNTGIFSGEDGGAMTVAISLGALTAVMGGIYIVAYVAKRKKSSVRFRR